MNRLTKKYFIGSGVYGSPKGTSCDDLYFLHKVYNKLGQLEDIEKELGIDLVRFLTECSYVLKNSSMTIGKMTNGKEIRTDFGYVEDFIRGIKEELENEQTRNI